MRRVAAILAVGHAYASSEQDTTTFATPSSPTTVTPSLTFATPSSPTTATPSLRPTKVDDAERTCEDEFGLFVRKYSKHYASPAEKDRRKQIFCDNLAWIKKRNGEDHKYSVGITPFVDLSPEEFRSAYSLPSEYKKANMSAIWGGLPEISEEPGLLRSSATPDSVDWRSQGAVSVVQQQGHCGACWTFATAGAVEGAWKVFGGGLYTLSEQQILDCAGAQYGNMGCSGGNPINGFAYIHDKGLCTARSYNYRAVQGTCRETSCTQVIPPGGVRGYRTVARGDENALMQAVAQQPVAVSIDGDSLVFQMYTGGVITANCGSKLDHGVLLVGYGNAGGQPYWIIKNSWGPDWGENGFGRLARGVGGPGECGILSESSYPVLDRSKVVPGTFDPNPGTIAAIAFAALFACCAMAFCFTQFCKRRPGRQPLLSSSPAPVVQATARPAMPNPWASQQAVTPAPAVPAATAPGAVPVATAQATQAVRSGNSAASRLVQQ